MPRWGGRKDEAAAVALEVAFFCALKIAMTKFDNRRKHIRVAVKRILKKYGYPPDLRDAAIKTAVELAEALARVR